MEFYEFRHPEEHTNYIDRHNNVDTNYVSSGRTGTDEVEYS